MSHLLGQPLLFYCRAVNIHHYSKRAYKVLCCSPKLPSWLVHLGVRGSWGLDRPVLIALAPFNLNQIMFSINKIALKQNYVVYDNLTKQISLF